MCTVTSFSKTRAGYLKSFMKLLLISQVLDSEDDVLGFFHGWAREFARQTKQLIVLVLRKGSYTMPENTTVYSLGKERGVSRLSYVLNFFRIIIRERKKYDAVFVHMNQEYVVLGGWLWRLLGKKVSLWYAHGHTPFSLRVAEKFVHIVFTSTKSGCRLRSGKIRVIGQGIDVEQFKIKNPPVPVRTGEKLKIEDGVLRIVSVGRISPVKRYETLLDAVATLRERGISLRADIFGKAGTPEQADYEKTLHELTKQKGLCDIVRWRGSVPNREIAEHLAESDIFVNTSITGSLDKAGLEAMAMGIPVLTSNEAYAEVLGELSGQLMYAHDDATSLAEKVIELNALGEAGRHAFGEKLQGIVVRDHNLTNFVGKIVGEL